MLLFFPTPGIGRWLVWPTLWLIGVHLMVGLPSAVAAALRRLQLLRRKNQPAFVTAASLLILSAAAVQLTRLPGSAHQTTGFTGILLLAAGLLAAARDRRWRKKGA
jgi:hypothetical protein